MQSVKAFERSSLRQTVAQSQSLLISLTMNLDRQKKINHVNMWDRAASKLSFVKFIPTNGQGSSSHCLIQAENLHTEKSVHLANLITTKKEICIDLALHSLLNFPGLLHCGFPVHSQSLLPCPGPSLDADNNRKEYLEHFGIMWMSISPITFARSICFIYKC